MNETRLNKKGWCPWADLNCRPLPYQGSALPLSYMGRITKKSIRLGAGEGNRTLVISLEGFCSTIELHPPKFLNLQCLRFTHKHFPSIELLVEGEGFEPSKLSQQIYSLPPLTARESLRKEHKIIREHLSVVKCAFVLLCCLLFLMKKYSFRLPENYIITPPPKQISPSYSTADCPAVTAHCGASKISFA